MFPPLVASQRLPALHDDIECEEWLDEIGLSQYTETFLLNFTRGQSTMLSRKRLDLVRLSDFPRMNIEDFEDQKALLQHIRHTLHHPFRSPIRKTEFVLTRIPNTKENEIWPHVDATTASIELVEPQTERRGLPLVHKQIDLPEKRRRSFDRHAWQSISQLRTDAVRQANSAEHLRDLKSPPRRSRSFHLGPSFDELSTVEKGIKYGNTAQVLDSIQKEFVQLRSDHLRGLRSELGCERMDVFFVNEQTRETVACLKGTWYRLPMSSGLAGYCAETAEVVLVENASNDLRYNANIDDHLRLKTDNVLCHPIRGRRGGGDVVAVLQACNKASGAFTQADVTQMAACCVRIAEDLADRMAALLVAAAAFAGSAIFVGGKGGSAGGSRHHFDDPTTSYLAYVDTTLRLKTGVRHESSDLFMTGASSHDDVEMERVKLHKRQNY